MSIKKIDKEIELTSTMIFNLYELVKRLEIQKGQNVPYAYVAEKSGLSRFTIQKIALNQATRVDLETLQKLVDFFAAEGMAITINDLFRYE